ncbi:MAG: acyl-CoA dehydrogenase family protein, partial [Acidimicrobiales bacterium]
MDLRFTPDEDAFRKEVRAYLDDLLQGDFAEIRGRGGPGDEHAFFDERLAWERRLGADGWTCVGWPTEFGGRGLPLNQQVIYFEEYARAGGPGRLGHIGEGLIGPTIMHFGSPEQQQRFLPAIRLGEELWCQGYSEPDAGSDLA